MLSQEQKNQMIDVRVSRYEAQIYDLELDAIALRSVKDYAGAADAESRIKSLEIAKEAIAAEKVTANADA